jgi:hypothetical protein
MSRLGWAVLIIGCLFSGTPLRAAGVTVSGDSPRDITVAIDNTTVDLVVEDLCKRYGFEVGGLQYANKGDPLTATMSGSLQSILERLLRNWNYMIVRSSDNESGIVKVLILDAAYGASPTKVGQATAGADANKVLQALTGQD